MFAFNFTSDLLKLGYFGEAGRNMKPHPMVEVPPPVTLDCGSSRDLSDWM